MAPGRFRLSLRLRRPLSTCAAIAALSAATTIHTAAAQSVDRQARTWAATCAACHASGSAAAGGIPSLAGKDADQILRALLEFKNGQRPAATVMHQHAKGYSDEELRRIAQALGAAAR